jgi:hypothetical protein
VCVGGGFFVQASAVQHPALEFGPQLTKKQPFIAYRNDEHVLYVIDSE